MSDLFNELQEHVKISDVAKDNDCITCEVDRIQSVARSIVKRISSQYGDFKLTSTTKDVKNLGFTKIIIERLC